MGAKGKSPELADGGVLKDVVTRVPLLGFSLSCQTLHFMWNFLERSAKFLSISRPPNSLARDRHLMTVQEMCIEQDQVVEAVVILMEGNEHVTCTLTHKAFL